MYRSRMGRISATVTYACNRPGSHTLPQYKIITACTLVLNVVIVTVVIIAAVQVPGTMRH